MITVSDLTFPGHPAAKHQTHITLTINPTDKI